MRPQRIRILMITKCLTHLSRVSLEMNPMKMISSMRSFHSRFVKYLLKKYSHGVLLVNRLAFVLYFYMNSSCITLIPYVEIKTETKKRFVAVLF